MGDIKNNTLASLESITFPWDKLDKYKAIAQDFCANSGECFVDLSVGSPVDNVPQSLINSLLNTAFKPGYPLTSGTIDLRQAIINFLQLNFGARDLRLDNVLPTIGSKEAIGLLPQMLGIGLGDIIVRPEIAYPTYDIGAVSVGADVLTTDNISDWAGNPNVKLVWLNYPRNPTGECVDASHLREVVKATRQIGATLASDECYAMFDWRENGAKSATANKVHRSILDPDVNGGSFDNILMFYSLSKQLNLANFRQAFIAGDKTIIQNLLQIRKHLGLIMPGSMQDMMVSALELSGEKANAQCEVYRERHAILKAGLSNAGYEVEHSDGGLYVWVKAKYGTCWDDLEFLSKRGIIASPGEFYGQSAVNYLRFAITASTDKIKEAVQRLQS